MGATKEETRVWLFQSLSGAWNSTNLASQLSASLVEVIRQDLQEFSHEAKTRIVMAFLLRIEIERHAPKKKVHDKEKEYSLVEDPTVKAIIHELEQDGGPMHWYKIYLPALKERLDSNKETARPLHEILREGEQFSRAEKHLKEVLEEMEGSTEFLMDPLTCSSVLEPYLETNEKVDNSPEKQTLFRYVPPVTKRTISSDHAKASGSILSPRAFSSRGSSGSLQRERSKQMEAAIERLGRAKEQPKKFLKILELDEGRTEKKSSFHKTPQEEKTEQHPVEVEKSEAQIPVSVPAQALSPALPNSDSSRKQ
uniref:Uncharacterized protein n=1 Tax=Palpitomonas bilix TaxID=652834 RepID=A0A7S3DJP9_9EUKA|mmetsp:Transcript_41110/g.106232  ORF Transcript_41110/g.106232 Transcript_41110/m.106232 type:complete len:310 (+) Transcript_41110:171-1100(+)